MKISDIKEVGLGPVISTFYHQIGPGETINNTLTRDEKQRQPDPSTQVLSLLINILCGQTPLYQVEEFYAEQDVDPLFGPGASNKYFNDDVLARTLDKIHTAGPKRFLPPWPYRPV